MKKNKVALITGITGQDGSYLAEMLLEKGYVVHGLKRRSSSFNTARIDHLYRDPHYDDQKFFLHYGDLSDSQNISNIIYRIQPDEVYNLAAQSHVGVSYESPEYTADVTGLGTLRILEAIKNLKKTSDIRFYQASTSELYGLVQETPQKESTPFYPRSPYGVSKLFAHWITINYREAYDIYACNGILFNHESPRRGETFVTRKITRGLSRIVTGLESCLFMGNIDSLRDWGHARDYVEMQWLMLQQEQPEDFVIATGQQITVREFINRTANLVGLEIEWKGEGINEIGVIKNYVDTNFESLTPPPIGTTIVKIDQEYFRPAEVDSLIGDPSYAHKKLGWKPKTSLSEMIHEMIENDVNDSIKKAFLREKGL